MNKILDTIKTFAISVIIITTIFALMGIAGTVETYYKEEAVVVSADPYHNITEYMLSDGNCYATDFNCEVYKGDVVMLTMHNNHTDGNKYDDRIKKVKIISKKQLTKEPKCDII